MSVDLEQLLAEWSAKRNSACWVLAAVYATRGHSYRKAGAMMLISDTGERLGLLSGGCLEADIAQHAYGVMTTRRPRTLTYDTTDEGDVAYQLGSGCGGSVDIYLQLIDSQKSDVLSTILRRLQAGVGGWLLLDVAHDAGETPVLRWTEESGLRVLPGRGAQLVNAEERPQLVVRITPAPRLLVVGGGVDARPVVSIARELGWLVTVCDPRAAFARPEHFAVASAIHRGPPAQLEGTHFDAAVLMSHNLSIDAAALRWLRSQCLRYVGLLGPVSRKRDVLDLAGVTEADFPCPISGPAGLQLGGELPGEIALSIVAECQTALRGHTDVIASDERGYSTRPAPRTFDASPSSSRVM